MDDSNPELQNAIQEQGSFLGVHCRSLDSRKRLTLPAAWQAQIPATGSLYVTCNDTDLCLVVSMDEVQRRREHPVADDDEEQLVRILGPKSELITLDSKGRIRIKDDYLHSIGLTDQVVLAGAIHYFEIWHPDRWKKVGATGLGTIQETMPYIGL